MQYYITASVTGKLKLQDKDSFNPANLAATIISDTIEIAANKLRDAGFKVIVETSNGLAD